MNWDEQHELKIDPPYIPGLIEPDLSHWTDPKVIALVNSINSQQFDQIPQILKSGANPNFKCTNDKTGVSRTILFELLRIDVILSFKTNQIVLNVFKSFLFFGADVRMQEPEYKNTPLIIVAEGPMGYSDCIKKQFGQVDPYIIIAELLLEFGASLNQSNKFKVTPIMAATCVYQIVPNLQMIELLLKYDIDSKSINKPDIHNQTPLRCAISSHISNHNSHNKLVKLLLKYGAGI